MVTATKQALLSLQLPANMNKEEDNVTICRHTLQHLQYWLRFYDGSTVLKAAADMLFHLTHQTHARHCTFNATQAILNQQCLQLHGINEVVNLGNKWGSHVKYWTHRYIEVLKYDAISTLTINFNLKCILPLSIFCSTWHSARFHVELCGWIRFLERSTPRVLLLKKFPIHTDIVTGSNYVLSAGQLISTCHSRYLMVKVQVHGKII